MSMTYDDAPVLVVGATGILEPLVRTLVDRGTRVVGVARDPGRLAALAADLGDRFTPRAGDARLSGTLTSLRDGPSSVLAAGRRFAAAVAYAPAVDGDATAIVADVADGPVVLVLTSATAAPASGEDDHAAWSVDDLGPAAPGVRRLVLGWRADQTWHSSAEVSAAALDRLEATEDGDALLGEVRPWSERPGT
ncbi:MAG: hypothetical protein U0R80_05540 [Nocardioidaceae bacterium]